MFFYEALFQPYCSVLTFCMNCAFELPFNLREDNIRRSGNPGMMMKNPSEMENQVYSKANSKVSEDVITDVSHPRTDSNSSVYFT